ncbi:MAG TPA: winged helix-turn-helix domain-containing protein [Dokdonella sp.]|uniref:winged helix-turn-helix domain-containing protein n=1 Tax=Dokdonella sp. TaxID=2291710 RepID=UPI002C4DF829|nr:winged helix-turn-helix domain-containing protein [Dokdonella sp.]HUD43413.1 winged helix-turn-helix domain-containing protein [Dokdonella sp.]
MQPLAFRFGAFRLLPAARELWNGDTLVALPPRAFSCLVMLVEQRERAVGREELIGALWPRGHASDVQLGQLILQCRRAIDDDGQSQHAIRTVAGFGYRWIAPVEVERLRGDSEAPAASAPAVSPSGAAGSAAATDPAPASAAAAMPVPRSGRGRRAAWLAAAALLIAALIAVSAWLVRRPASEAARGADRIVVLPVASADADEPWIRLGGMDLVGDRLRRSGIAVVPSDATVSMLRSLGVAPTAMPGEAELAELRQMAGAAALVRTTLTRSGDAWLATASAAADVGPPLLGRYQDVSPVAALRGAADRLSAVLGHVPAAPADAGGLSETLQRARAAMLANEPAAARAILLADPALVRDEPRLRQHLAEVDIRSGRFEDARAALDALLAETQGQASVFRAEVLAARATVAIRTGAFSDAGRYASEGIELHADDDDAILVGRLHLARGVSRISMQDYSGALIDNGIAREEFQRAGDIASVARVDGNLGALENLRGHPALAVPYLESAIAQFQSLGVVQEQISNLQNLFVSLRQQLLNAQALAAIDRAWAMRERMVNPDSLLSVRLFRVQGLLRVGRHGEAAGLLDDPANDRTPADPIENDRIRLLRAELAWDRGQPAEALGLLEAVPEDEAASADNDVVRAAVAVLRSRLEQALGTPVTPPGSGEAAVMRAERSHPRMPLRGLAAANRAWTAGRLDQAEHAFQAALSLADAQGVAETTAAIVADYTRFLLAAGRVREAAAIAGRVALWAAHDYGCALTRLRLAHAQGRTDAWRAALEQARALAGERTIPAELVAAPGPRDPAVARSGARPGER